MKKDKAIVKASPVSLDTKKTGAGLVFAAETRYREMKQTCLVDATANLMKQLEDAKISRQWCEDVVSFLEDKIKALRAGKWHYEELHNTIVFDRKDLNLTQPESKRPDGVRGLGGRI